MSTDEVSLWEHLEDSSCKTGEAFLSEADILDWRRFWHTVMQQAKMSDPNPGKRVWETLPTVARRILEEAAQRGTLRKYDKPALVKGLNRALWRRDLYDQRHFHGVEISDEGRRLLQTGRRRPRLTMQAANRLLLHACNPSDIVPLQVERRGPGTDSFWARMARDGHRHAFWWLMVPWCVLLGAALQSLVHGTDWRWSVSGILVVLALCTWAATLTLYHSCKRLHREVAEGDRRLQRVEESIEGRAP